MIDYETPRLILRNYKKTDAEDYFEYMSLESTAEHEDFNPFTMEECEKAVGERLWDDSFWVAELKNTGKVIGDLCFREGEYDSFEIGFDFNIKYSKTGYASEACQKLLEHIFKVLNARRVTAGCNEGNINSKKLLERLKFRCEAVCLEDAAFKSDREGNPLYVNSCYYALLKSEWAGKQG